MAKTSKSADKSMTLPTKKKGGAAPGKAKKVNAKIKPKRVKASVARALKNKEAKLVENTKQLLVLRGNKTNEDVNQLLRDIKMIKAPDAKVLSKKNELHPFDDPNSIEFLTQKNDTSLFLLGSSTKKRPNNLIFGRTFDGHIMDMLEMGFENFKSISDFKCKSKMAPGSKPCFLFSGDEWESNEVYQKLKNIFLDIFRGTIVEAINLKGLDHVIVCSAVNNRVLFRHYSIAFGLTTDTHPRVELDEMGPRFDLSFRRHKFGSADLMKAACKKPKELAPKKVKNITRDELTGDKIGRIHVDKQDIYSLQGRRVKALRKSPGDLKKQQTDDE
ncbi:rRNA-binding ribosome biosynthesis protein rpf2 [Aphanomyces cochlioides]|nr:rRNA-binding ribosome biosynthesis protein rpf2 [Aphanomyces cochlioides]